MKEQDQLDEIKTLNQVKYKTPEMKKPISESCCLGSKFQTQSLQIMTRWVHTAVRVGCCFVGFGLAGSVEKLFQLGCPYADHHHHAKISLFRLKHL